MLAPALPFQLENRDCLEGMAEMDAASVDVVVTSPPYNLGIRYNSYDDRMGRQEYFEWCAQWGRELKRLLKEDGSFFLNVGASPSDPMLPHEIAVLFAKEFVLQNTFHWIKSISVPVEGETRSVGHFKPINSPRYVTDCHEYVFHFTPEGNTRLDRLSIGVPYQHKSNIGRWGHTQGKDKRCRGNNWFVPYKTINSRAKDRPHPATFPVELAENCLRLHEVGAGSVVLDPFVGIGSSALAARRCGAGRFVGFDIDADYLTVAQERLAAEEAEATP